MLHAASTLVLVLIGLGLYNRRRPQIHWRLMTAALVTDFALVLYIELTRHAVGTVTSGFKPLVWFHAGISTTVLALYVAMLILGRRLLVAPALAVAGGGALTVSPHAEHTRSMHRNLGMTFVVFRLLNYVTAFMI